MNVRHDDEELANIESNPNNSGGMDQSRVHGFRKVMNVIRGVSNETELYQWKGLRFEKLKGSRSHQRSLKINEQWRLIVEIEKGEGQNANICVIKAIEDYH